MLMISAVARIVSPGSKVDAALTVLEGKQGLLKSTAIKALFDPWFTDEIADLGSKDSAMQCAGVWCVEIAELDAMNKAEVSKVKAFLSRTTDRYRPPYGRRVVERPRSCIFFGSTNARDYLKDATGARRFHPLAVGVESKIDVEGLRSDRDLLWAEAVEGYNKGDAWWFSDPSNRRTAIEASAQQEERYQLDPWEQPISRLPQQQAASATRPPRVPGRYRDCVPGGRQSGAKELVGSGRGEQDCQEIMQRLRLDPKTGLRRDRSTRGKPRQSGRWFYCRSPTKEELEIDARQAELKSAE